MAMSIANVPSGKRQDSVDKTKQKITRKEKGVLVGKVGRAKKLVSWLAGWLVGSWSF